MRQAQAEADERNATDCFALEAEPHSPPMVTV